MEILMQVQLLEQAFERDEPGIITENSYYPCSHPQFIQRVHLLVFMRCNTLVRGILFDFRHHLLQVLLLLLHRFVLLRAFFQSSSYFHILPCGRFIQFKVRLEVFQNL